LPSLCCFWCPASDFRNREPGEKCATCGRAFEVPLQQPPSRVASFVIEEAISRGFYSAVYRARQESLGRTVVLKIVPVSIYEYFKKDWSKECQEHAKIAEGTPFVANITDQFRATVTISSSPIECFVAVLENIPGPTLEQVLTDPDRNQLTPRTAAQIAADLFEIFHLFAHRERFHNDLHGGNIIVQRVPPTSFRSGVIDPGVRAVAIDLGSVLDADRSGDHGGRVLGDQHQIARHISHLATSVQNRRSSDLDYRIAGTLRGLAEHLAPETGAQRVMTVDDASAALRSALSSIDEPWRQPLSLHRFGDAYNAQALESWHVPELWFDPQDKWLTRTSARGPQVITGMRGCGKTMLLRALHFHARAAEAQKRGGAISSQLDRDQFLGLYASCQKLLDPYRRPEGNETGIALPFERLYVAYIRDAIRVLRHLRSMDSSAVVASIDVLLRDSLKPLEISSGASFDTGERSFEQFLTDLQFQLAEGEAGCKLKMAPAEAFGHLAMILQGAAPVFAGKYVLFLLDDVSTRYLHYDMVREVISKLLFQHPKCAFRITTEAQALQRMLLSPGGTAPADPNRDFDEFDLGNEVYRLLQEGSTKEKMEFVSEILRRRGKQFQDELYRREPVELLGDISLEQIADEIATSSASSPARKRVYRGLRALQAVCVGDLGDVVKLYEKILMRANPSEPTVPPEKQCDCFLEHSASLMHFLNRRDQHKKSLALSFAQASGELLTRSAKNGTTGKRRLRQYTKLYVRVDAGPDFDSVVATLLDLLDAGVFVYDGGAPRAKTRDNDPVLQFKLSYRKMLGLASYMGLSDRDRFELSGENLKQWLSNPADAKDILVESESKSIAADTERQEDADVQTRHLDSQPSVEPHAGESSQPKPVQLTFSESSTERTSTPIYPSLGLYAEALDIEQLADRNVEAAVIALGFEDRTVESAKRLLSVVRPRRLILVQYDDHQGREIADEVNRLRIPAKRVGTYQDLCRELSDIPGEVVLDASGFSKPFLFVAARDRVRQIGRLLVVHTLAEEYFPRDEDLEGRGISIDSQDNDILSRLGDVFMGEQAPYNLTEVHQEMAEPERWRALMASASPKNDRLLHLLDARTYDAARIFAPPPTSIRRRVARVAAQLSASAADSNVALIDVDTNDLPGALRKAEEVYNELYFGSGANIEIGLTGSKMHSIAFGALAGVARVAAAWYVSPKAYDMDRFTRGTCETRCFELLGSRSSEDNTEPRRRKD
jgi:hypothetical protein